MTMSANDIRTALLTDPPKFHFWDGEPQVGGFGPHTLRLIENVCAPDAEWAETGAGLSTVWLLHQGVRLNSFFINYDYGEKIDLGEKITQFATRNGISLDRWWAHVGPSELTLPKWASELAVELLDACILDGSHAIQVVMTDFVYLNYALKPDGLMLIDDLQLSSCQLLREMLVQSGFYEPVGGDEKTAFLRKSTRLRLLPDFGSQKSFLAKLGVGLSQAAANSESL